MAFGPWHAKRMAKSDAAMGSFLKAMGNNVSAGPGKPHVFASSKAGRRKLRRGGRGDRDVLLDWRGLGAHANVSARDRAPTLMGRARDTARLVKP
eukprot:9381784-Lingulodinium_polyedra.AAC.1